MNCPVEIVDYTSSLIAADWYEEQGELHKAEATRTIPTNGTWLIGWYYHCYSKKMISFSGYAVRGIRHNSAIRSRLRLYSTSKCSGSQRRYHTSQSETTKRRYPDQ